MNLREIKQRLRDTGNSPPYLSEMKKEDLERWMVEHLSNRELVRAFGHRQKDLDRGIFWRADFENTDAVLCPWCFKAWGPFPNCCDYCGAGCGDECIRCGSHCPCCTGCDSYADNNVRRKMGMPVNPLSRKVKERHQLLRYMRGFMERMWEDGQPEGTDPKAAAEAVWCNARDDKPSEYFQGLELAHCSMEQIELLLDQVVKILEDEREGSTTTD